jgi:hypothetical protein
VEYISRRLGSRTDGLMAMRTLLKGTAMQIIVGPVLTRKGGYAFDCWTPEEGLSCGYTYGRIEDAHANDSEYGLHAFVSGTDVQRARRVASQIQAGRVAINGMLDDQQAPLGGFKHSGVGREFGTYGIEAFLEPRAILE